MNPPACPTSPIASALPAVPQRLTATLSALFALTKPRLAFFSILTAMAAYGAAQPAGGASRAWLVLAGTALAAGGALSLNQWWERDTDGRMRRTRIRPLPSGQIAPGIALAWSLFLSIGGTVVLAWYINFGAAGFALATILLYGVVYTPLKRRTRWATEIGSIAGALPPLLGSAAAGDVLAAPGWILAAVLLCWQMPHFFAIGWLHRDDYRAAGFPLLPAIDPTGQRTAAWSLGYTIALALCAVLPWALALAGPVYGMTAALASGAMLVFAVRFLRANDNRHREARLLFLASVLYLPVLMGALVFDRVPFW